MAPVDSNGNVEVPSRVLVYSHSWLPGQVDGVAVRMMAHVKELVKRGSKVLLLTPDFVLPGGVGLDRKPVGKIHHTAFPGVEHITVATSLTPVYRKNFCMSLTLGNLLTVVGAIQRFKPDCVHATQEASLQILVTACAWCDVPLIVSMHTDVGQIQSRDSLFSFAGPIGRLYTQAVCFFPKFGYRNWARGGANFLPVSKHARTMLNDAGIPAEAINDEEWGPMVDRDLFCVDQPEDKVEKARQKLTFGIPDAWLMMYVGRVTAEKDIQFLVDALDRAPKNVVLALVGPGSLCQELSKMHGKEQRLHCTGEFVAREDVASYLRAADACVSASTMETVGFTAMEALSCGTPMLAANAQGFAEHLDHGVNARLYTPHDEASFDSELKQLMAAGRKGNWAPEPLRASMDKASVPICTDRALRAYLKACLTKHRLTQTVTSLLWFFFNWVVNCVVF